MKIIRSESLDIEIAASMFVALGSEQRLGVLKTLVRAGPKGLTIGVLGERSGVTGSTLTHHLRILTQAELVQQSKQGRSVVCAAVAYAKVAQLSEFLLQECCAECGGSEGDHHHDG